MAKGGAGGRFQGKSEGVAPQGKFEKKFEKRGFEKRMEYQNPEMFAGAEVSGGVVQKGCGLRSRWGTYKGPRGTNHLSVLCSLCFRLWMTARDRN